jgi:hypothetical protein
VIWVKKSSVKGKPKTLMDVLFPSSEAEITAAIRAYLGIRGVWHWKVWQGPMSQPKGVSDILGAYRGRLLAIEVKRPGKNPTPDQQRFLDRVKIEGGVSFVACSVADVMENLKEFK